MQSAQNTIRVREYFGDDVSFGGEQRKMKANDMHIFKTIDLQIVINQF